MIDPSICPFGATDALERRIIRIEDKLDKVIDTFMSQNTRLTKIETQVNAVPVIASAIGGIIGVVSSIGAAVLGVFNNR